MNPVAVVLSMLADHLLAEATESPQGRAAQRVSLDHERLRMTAIGFTAGGELPDHANPGEATLQVLVGLVRLTWEGGELELEAGMIGRIPDARHRLEALEPSVVLLTAIAVD